MERKLLRKNSKMKSIIKIPTNNHLLGSNNNMIKQSFKRSIILNKDMKIRNFNIKRMKDS